MILFKPNWVLESNFEKSSKFFQVFVSNNNILKLNIYYILCKNIKYKLLFY